MASYLDCTFQNNEKAHLNVVPESFSPHKSSTTGFFFLNIVHVHTACVSLLDMFQYASRLSPNDDEKSILAPTFVRILWGFHHMDTLIHETLQVQNSCCHTRWWEARPLMFCLVPFLCTLHASTHALPCCTSARGALNVRAQ